MIDESTNAAASSRKKVNGTYHAETEEFRIVLRVDIDGNEISHRVSGDVFHKYRNESHYSASFIVDSPVVTWESEKVTAVGRVRCNVTTPEYKIEVTIDLRGSVAPSSARLIWLDDRDLVVADYGCSFASSFFRTVQIEEDWEEGVTPVREFLTNSIPGGGDANANRSITVRSAYADAGIEVVYPHHSDPNMVPSSEAGSDVKWTDAELHDAMERHFFLRNTTGSWRDEPDWLVWFFHARRYEENWGGVMFDLHGDRHRQGCALFYAGIDSNSPRHVRHQLFNSVHEIGHCFNLMHSFFKWIAIPPDIPPIPGRSVSSSFMNYPSRASDFYDRFNWEFDLRELFHLRHAFYPDIIPGGNRWKDGAAGPIPKLRASRQDNPLSLEIRTPYTHLLGEPVFLELILRSSEGVLPMSYGELDPKLRRVLIMVRDSQGRLIHYHSPVCGFLADPTTSIQRHIAYESSYIGFDGSCGHIFATPGTYEIQAVFIGTDGSVTHAPAVRTTIQGSPGAMHDHFARIMLGEDQGLFFALNGSDSEFLAPVRHELKEAEKSYPEHVFCKYLHLMDAMMVSREFKATQPDGSLSVKAADPKAGAELIHQMLDASDGEVGARTGAIHHAATMVIRNQAAAGKLGDAKKTLKRLTQFLSETMSDDVVDEVSQVKQYGIAIQNKK